MSEQIFFKLQKLEITNICASANIVTHYLVKYNEITGAFAKF